MEVLDEKVHTKAKGIGGVRSFGSKKGGGGGKRCGDRFGVKLLVGLGGGGGVEKCGGKLARAGVHTPARLNSVLHESS